MYPKYCDINCDQRKNYSRNTLQSSFHTVFKTQRAFCTSSAPPFGPAHPEYAPPIQPCALRWNRHRVQWL